MFIKNATDSEIASLLKTLSSAVTRHKDDGFRVFVYFESKSPDELKALNKKLKTDNVALAIIPKKDRKSTYQMYAVNPQADSTVIVYQSRNVLTSMANYQAKDDSKALLAAIAKACKSNR